MRHAFTVTQTNVCVSASGQYSYKIGKNSGMR